MIPYKKIVITGGAGFVGSNLAILLKQNHPHLIVIALDNLYRRGSELAIPRLQQAEVQFIHGDIRIKEDLEAVDGFDLMIECSAEPSVRAGYLSSPAYLIQTNLSGTINCLEIVRQRGADLVFLSTSRVYSLKHLQSLPLEIQENRFTLKSNGQGWSEHGLDHTFSIQGPRSLYGATKLAAELLIQEYMHMYSFNTIINRCGVIAGPWQMGKVDQGFVTLWLARHLFKGSLQYSGFDGKGLQVRDILHIEDLYDLLCIQLQEIRKHTGCIYNVGGGLNNSTSLKELTVWCEENVGWSIDISSDSKTQPFDMPYYVTDNAMITQSTGWTPKRSLHHTLSDILSWLHQSQEQLKKIMQ